VDYEANKARTYLIKSRNVTVKDQDLVMGSLVVCLPLLGLVVI